MDINSAFYRILLKFGHEVGKQEALVQSMEIVVGATLLMALLFCFFGIKLVRLCSAVMAFFLTAIAICEMLRPTADMGVIVITFAVAGLINAFLVYHWYKFGVFLFSAMIGYSILAVITSTAWICFGAAILLGTTSLFLPPVVIMLSTAFWGGVTLGFEGASYMGINQLPFQFTAVVLLTAAGLFNQYHMNKRREVGK